jgi:hypothetical protein
MSDQQVNLPYFDLLLTLLDNGYPEIDLAFGRHVHWGYWFNPEQALNVASDFSKAAEQLTREVYSGVCACFQLIKASNLALALF